MVQDLDSQSTHQNSIFELAYRCMDANPDKRPTANETKNIINLWNNSFDNEVINSPGYSKKQKDEFQLIRDEFKKIDEIKFDPSTITATIHPNAVYTSRLLKFTSLSQPVNSNKVTMIGNNNGNY